MRARYTDWRGYGSKRLAINKSASPKVAYGGFFPARPPINAGQNALISRCTLMADTLDSILPHHSEDVTMSATPHQRRPHTAPHCTANAFMGPMDASASCIAGMRCSTAPEALHCSNSMAMHRFGKICSGLACQHIRPDSFTHMVGFTAHQANPAPSFLF